MQIIDTIRVFYIFYTVYTFFVMSVSDYNAIYALVGLVSMWILFFALSLGFKSSKRVQQTDFDCLKEDSNCLGASFPFHNMENWRTSFYIFNAIVCWLCSVLAARFYTGRGLLNVVSGLLNGTGGYAAYQRHLREANIAAFTLAKLPYFLMLTYCTAMVFWSITAILLSSRKITPVQIIYVALVILAYLYFGVARGTNYEMYIVFVSLAYCIFNRNRKSKQSFNAKQKSILVVAIIGFIVIAVFRIVLESRGYSFANQICTEIRYDSEKLVSKVFPFMTTIGLGLFRYLGWGIFTIGYMNTASLDSFSSLVALLLPRGHKLLFGNTWENQTRLTLDVGVGWVPDYMSILDLFGIPLMLVVVFLVGRLLSGLRRGAMPRLLVDLINLFVFIEMLSIPVGNFLVTSTPVILSLLASLLWYGKCLITSRRQRR